MLSLDCERRRFNLLLASIGLMLPGQSMFAARVSGAHPRPLRPDMQPKALHLSRNDGVPNNLRLPVVVYPNVIRSSGAGPAGAFEAGLDETGWPPQWRDGLFTYHPYHSTAREVLSFVSVHASLMLGGPGGQVVPVRAGNVGQEPGPPYSTVTDLARFRGLSTSVPRAHAV